MDVKEAIEQLEQLKKRREGMLGYAYLNEKRVWERDVEALIIARDALKAKV